ncbi:spermine oxidase isoform X2 [Bombyx mandarina]|uniref:Spermine oxidase isoform X2 n=1 Tax=Bombyx mandarina TaxID=7092 RepID=A0A6J2KAR2_BOMMA|nr:spermine oxidase isoform X2 [Bombyx mandarina]
MGDENLGSSEKCNSSKKFKVIIIGCGIAGLSSANYLLQNGMEDFLILEARKRIGGRIISIPMKSHNVELGANWIHGVLGNPIFELAMSHNLVNIINIPKPHKVIAATENGKQVPFGILHEIHEAYVCFLRRCEEYFLCQYLPPPDIHSVGEHINLEATLYLERLPSSEEKKLRRLIFDCLLKRETCISGCHSMDEVDLLELGSYTELQGGNIMIPSGFSSILDPLKKNINDKKILTNHAVRKIIWDSDVNQSLKSLDDTDKIYLEYERPFLNPDITEIMLLWETPTTPEDMSQSWYKKIYSFSKVSETLLLGWVSGKEAEYMETLSMEEVAETCTKILRKFLNDPFVPEPQKCVCTSWREQPYTRGSYTAIAVGASQSDVESLAQPIFRNVHDKKPVLLFAGEHTHSSYYSTAHGAYLSGQIAARRLLAPDEASEGTLDCPDSADLNSWIQGIQLEG